MRPKKTFRLFDKSPPEPVLVLTPEERHRAELYRTQAEAFRRRFTKPAFSATPPSTPGTGDALLSLWPEPEHLRIPVPGFLRYLVTQGKRLDLARLHPLVRDLHDLAHEPHRLVARPAGSRLYRSLKSRS